MHVEGRKSAGLWDFLGVVEPMPFVDKVYNNHKLASSPRVNPPYLLLRLNPSATKQQVPPNNNDLRFLFFFFKKNTIGKNPNSQDCQIVKRIYIYKRPCRQIRLYIPLIIANRVTPWVGN